MYEEAPGFRLAPRVSSFQPAPRYLGELVVIGHAHLPLECSDLALEQAVVDAHDQGLTLVHFSAQLEPCLTHKNTLHTLKSPLTRATQPLRATPIP